MNKFMIVEPEGRRKSWSIRGYSRDRWVATWTCDSEQIARLVAKRLRKGQAPGWAAHDLRNSGDHESAER
jgi:hypothetical protein